MIYSLYEDSTAARCLGIIERHAAKFMRIGGGAISEEHFHPWVRTTDEQKARALTLAREGRLNATEIAREVGSTQSAVYKIIERAGVKARDGRRRGAI